MGCQRCLQSFTRGDAGHSRLWSVMIGRTRLQAKAQQMAEGGGRQPFATARIPATADGDGVKPGAESAPFGLVALQILEDIHHRFLHHVLGILYMQQNTVGKLIQARCCHLVQRRERFLIALQAALDQRLDGFLILGCWRPHTGFAFSVMNAVPFDKSALRILAYTRLYEIVLTSLKPFTLKRKDGPPHRTARESTARVPG